MASDKSVTRDAELRKYMKEASDYERNIKAGRGIEKYKKLKAEALAKAKKARIPSRASLGVKAKAKAAPKKVAPRKNWAGRMKDRVNKFMDSGRTTQIEKANTGIKSDRQKLKDKKKKG